MEYILIGQWPHPKTHALATDQWTFSTQRLQYHYTHVLLMYKAIRAIKVSYENMICNLLPRRTHVIVCVHEKFLTHVKHPSTARMLPKWLVASVEIVQLA